MMKNGNLTLTREQIEEINRFYVHNIDKWQRMFAGLSSDLINCEDGILYLEIVNRQTNILSAENTAIRFACSWKNANPELKNAKGFVVVFKDTDTAPGFSISANRPKEKIIQKFTEMVQQKEDVEPRIVGVYSGLFSEALENVKQDLVRDK